MDNRTEVLEALVGRDGIEVVVTERRDGDSHEVRITLEPRGGALRSLRHTDREGAPANVARSA